MNSFLDVFFTQQRAENSGLTDHKNLGSDHSVDFESRIGSFFGSEKKKIAFHSLLKAYFKYFYTPAETKVASLAIVSNKTITQSTSIDEQPTT